jgi:hypothetical protein
LPQSVLPDSGNLKLDLLYFLAGCPSARAAMWGQDGVGFDAAEAEPGEDLLKTI